MFSRIHSMKKYAWALAFVAFLISAPISLDTNAHSYNIANAETGAVSYSSTQALTQAAKENAEENAASARKAEAEDDSLAGKIARKILNAVGKMVMSIGSYLLIIAGFFFDKSITEFVGNFSIWYDKIGTVLVSMWSIVRDLCNLAFIFGFIYIGIKTIVDPDNASTKRFLSTIIIGAILINFSLYLVQLIIDMGNFVAVTIYNVLLGFAANGSLSLGILNMLGLASFYQSDLGSPVLQGLEDSNLGFVFYFMAGIFLIVTAFVLLVGAILLLVRFVELVIIMVFSPLIFGARVFPQTEPVSKKILSKLFSAAFFAPVYMLMMFISLKFAEVFSKTVSSGAFNTVLTDVSGMKDGFMIVINYVIIIFLMISALTLSLKIGATGAGMAISVGNNMKNRAQNGLKKGSRYVAGGAAGYAGRFGVRALNAGAQKVGIGDLKDVGARTEKYRQAMRGSTRTGLDGFYDRTIKGRVVGAIGAAAGATGTKLTEVKFGSQYSIKSKDDENAKYRKAYENREKEKENDDKFTKAIAEATRTDGDLIKATKDLADAMKKMSNEKIGGMSQKQLTDARIAANLTDDQMKHLKETKSAAEYKEIEDKRKEARANIAKNGDPVLDATAIDNQILASTTQSSGESDADYHKRVARKINNHVRAAQQKLLTGDVEKLPAKYFTDKDQAIGILPHTDPAKLEKRLSAGDLDGTDKDDIRKNLDAYIAKLKASSTTADKNRLKKWEKALNDKIELSNLGVTV